MELVIFGRTALLAFPWAFERISNIFIDFKCVSNNQVEYNPTNKQKLVLAIRVMCVSALVSHPCEWRQHNTHYLNSLTLADWSDTEGNDPAVAASAIELCSRREGNLIISLAQNLQQLKTWFLTDARSPRQATHRAPFAPPGCLPDLLLSFSKPY